MVPNSRALASTTAAALILFSAPAFAQSNTPDASENAESAPVEVAEAEESAAKELEEAAQDELDAELDELLGKDSGRDDKPWSIGASLGFSVGQGTFVRVANDSPWADEVHDGSGAYNRVSMRFGISPSYSVGDFNFSGNLGFSQGLTPNNGMNGPYETRLGDLGLSAGWKGWSFDAIGVSLRPSLSISLPTSRTSQVATMLLSSSLGLSASKTFFKRLTIGASLSGSRTFHRYTSPVIEIDDIGEENAIYRYDGSEAVAPGLFAVGGINTPYSLGTGLSASMSFPNKLSASVSYNLRTSWAYRVNESDEFSSQYECRGLGCAGQGASGSISLGYPVTDWLSASLSASTFGGPRTPDQKSFVFPFWNFNGAATNQSSIGLGLSGSY
ncbi:hypothetical protein DL240_14955 [Lujinxingia litoralis]|uniref:Uncharacterized protein n=1 Tax=Lujinxingia litoralis TaxID=2211119 RepID=A0A328C2N0_9DELT|nr:hypothetical protein [Lujinxingia litoralis]RAL20967.1 hypothetical protein DL240_14955 [Lujinxingia litoralis]